MSSISQALSHFPDVQHLFQSPSFTASTNQLQARSQTQTNTNLSFVTAEGDRVSLSTGSEVNTSFGSYTFQGLAEGQAVSLQSQQFSTSIQQNFNLLIEGDLNEQEQADIQEFLKSAQNILQELGEGDIEEATKAAASLGKLDSLSQASLFYRKSTSVSLATQSTRLAVQEEAGLNEASRERSNSRPERVGTLDQILEKIREAQEKFQLDPEQLVNRLPKLVTTLIDSLSHDSELTDSPPSIFQQIQKEFLESLLKSTNDAKSSQETEDTLAERTNPTNPVPPISDQEVPVPTPSQLETIVGQTKLPVIESTPI